LEKESSRKPLITLAKITGFIILGFVILLAILPIFLSKTINTKVSEWAHTNINGEVVFTDINLSFFKHFPHLTVTLYDLDLKGSAPFEKESLIKADEIALGIDLKSILGEKININKFYIDDAFINIQTDSLGLANYNIYKTAETDSTQVTDTSSTSLSIELIKISNSHLVYNDRSLPMLIDAKGFNYVGKGDLMQSVFTLHTHAKIDSLNFIYDKQPYLQNKKIDANLITQINTNSLTFLFEKNDLKINKLPLTFTGKFAFLSNGYDMEFLVNSQKSNLEDFVSALPPDYLHYFKDTELKGKADVSLSLSGQYIAEEAKMPKLDFAMAIENGTAKHKKAPFPVKNLNVNVTAQLPSLDPQKLDLNISKFTFNVEEDVFDAHLKLKGLDPCIVESKVTSKLNLEKLDRALELPGFDFKGLLDLNFNAKGTYATAIKHSGIRRVDTVVTSIPTFNLKSTFNNGYFKYADLPAALENISFAVNAACTDGNYKNTSVELTNLNVNLLDNYLKGYFKIADLNKYTVNSELKSVFKLEDIAKFYPIEGVEFKGLLNINATANGTYEPRKQIFPVTVTEVSLHKGFFKSAEYPIPLNNIDILTRISSSKGSFKDLKIEILPLSFNVSQEPFMLKANLEDFNNLKYDIKSKGNINLAQIYKIFGISGYDLAGKIKTNLSLKGKQSDATNGLYHKLDNKGLLEVQDIQFSSDFFPKPFLIKTGRFSFYREKMLFKNFAAHYGESAFNAEGHLINVINYIAGASKNLEGNFKLSANQLNVNEFMAYADTETDSQASNTASGVVLIPEDINIAVSAAVKNIKYDELNLDNFRGEAETKGGKLLLKNTGFDLIGTTVNMNATYAPSSPKKAHFTYDIKADNFDIQKAYKEVKLFREMASAAKDAHGIISLNYSLEGNLNENMSPIMSSLAGSGVLSLNKIKFKGFKLMNNIASRTSASELKDADVSQVNIKTSIKNNIMTIERTRMKIAGFRPRFEGQVSLDGKMNIGFRLGLPPLGIIGIPVKITGTQDNPIIKVGRQSKEDNLEETTEEN